MVIISVNQCSIHCA